MPHANQPMPQFLTEWAQKILKNLFSNSPNTLFFVFRNSRFKCVFFEKNAFFRLRKAYCFLPPRLETAPIDQNGPNLDKNCLLGISRIAFFLFFEIRVLSAFFSKKTRFFGSGRH